MIKLEEKTRYYTKEELIQHCKDYQAALGDAFQDSGGTIESIDDDMNFIDNVINFLNRTLSEKEYV